MNFFKAGARRFPSETVPKSCQTWKVSGPWSSKVKVSSYVMRFFVFLSIIWEDIHQDHFRCDIPDFGQKWPSLSKEPIVSHFERDLVYHAPATGALTTPPWRLVVCSIQIDNSVGLSKLATKFLQLLWKSGLTFTLLSRTVSKPHW